MGVRLHLLSLLLTSLALTTHAQVAPSTLIARRFNPLNVDTPSPEDGPPISANALRDKSYLPAQIGGIVGAYALSLVLVAITLLSLAKKRREHIHSGHDVGDFGDNKELLPLQIVPPSDQGLGDVPNFSYPSPRVEYFDFEPARYPSPVSSVGVPGVSPFVDPRIVAADKIMAQSQLEDMYKHVMEHEDAKERGVQRDAPSYPADSRAASIERPAPATLAKKERTKPASLNLSSAKEDRSTGSKTSSLLSALRSPKKKSVKGVNISSPILTPQSASFPRHSDASSMAAIPPRQYANLPPPPPVPHSDHVAIGMARTRGSVANITPDQSPESVQSIDERIGAQLDFRRDYGQGKVVSQHVAQEPDPESATSEHSQVPLVGLPRSPKPNATFGNSTLPSSPKPGASFSRPNAPSAVRTGGSLPLRAYEPALSSPSAVPQTTKQTVFERKGPLSPMDGRTPGTSMPYSPYQPFTPCMPMTPSLVTREERRKMKKMVPKTPTMELVQSPEDVW
ncbi:uncharacterized protein J7T54_003134 [Emericellopsis cladophorae]|uniref:Uncharacterized protein n=1 Tax=Emericellopsis cladophorae TaxID=2686198 RepID=A0A9Q0BCN3_9HYPO|nr:uncharacterized protein J7T54_003134 [Emericellopsis cladophorae]KAI6780992.1 hypothetical protein J7T54_003134 [Emericellopsis cladophorae]